MPAKPGEIPHKYPSITAQAKQVPNPWEVDLVLVDGGINDMGAEKILNPIHLFDPDWIRGQAAAYCGRMKDLLTLTILPRFTKAIIVVTGYYPLISQQSDPFKAAKLMNHLCPDLATAASIFERIERTFLAPLAQQSSAWVEASNQALRAAVESANFERTKVVAVDRSEESGARQSSHTTSGSQSRPAGVVFAPVNFGPEHCYAAPATLLWTLGEEDSVMTDRLKQCLQFAFGNPTCPFEPAFHPNRKGAEAYAGAINADLNGFISFWKPVPS